MARMHSLIVISALLAGGLAALPMASAQTQPSPHGEHGSTSSGSSGMQDHSGMQGGGHDMSGRNMQQMMDHCRQMQGMDPGAMNADMKRMARQCEQMMRSHGSASGRGESGQRQEN